MTCCQVDLEPLNVLGAFLVLAASAFYAAASFADCKLVIRSSGDCQRILLRLDNAIQSESQAGLITSACRVGDILLRDG